MDFSEDAVTRILFGLANLDDVFKMSEIYRHNHRFTLNKESVAEHSHFVTYVVLTICERYRLTKDKDFRDMMLYALIHDCPEIITNDIPYTAKREANLYENLDKFDDKFLSERWPSLKITPLVKTIVKLADKISMYFFVKRELELNNKQYDKKEFTYDLYKQIIDYFNKFEELVAER